MFRQLRILLLLLVLLVVAVNTWRAKAKAVEWKAPLHVVVYPINGDGSKTSADYLAAMRQSLFAPIEEFMQSEAARYGVRTAWGVPVTIRLAPRVRQSPPAPPTDGNVLGVIWWSLRLRYWARSVDTYDGPRPQVRLFVQYYDPAGSPVLAHSLGLQKGMLGVVNVFATRHMEGSNNFVVAHELLHTLGASDKYLPGSNQPRFPHGYAEPQRQPLHPQDSAEIMAGRIALSETQAVTPESLQQVVVGAATAIEINWIK